MYISTVVRTLGRFCAPLLHPQEAGAGAGGDAFGAAHADGAGASGSGDGGDGDGAPALVKLTDDTLFDPGDGKPVKWKDYRAGVVPRGEFDTRMEAGKRLLMDEAQKIEAAWQRFEQGRGPKPRDARPQSEDLLESIGNMPVVDGATIRKLYQSGLGPIAQLVTQQQATLAALQQRLDRTEQTTSRYTEEAATRQFEQAITEHLIAIPEIKGVQGVLKEYANDPAVRELAKDLWLSHDQASWKPDEFRSMLAGRIEGFVALVRKMDRDAVEKRKAETRQRFFDGSKGGATGNGKRGYVHRTAQELADELFAHQSERV